MGSHGPAPLVEAPGMASRMDLSTHPMAMSAWPLASPDQNTVDGARPCLASGGLVRDLAARQAVHADCGVAEV
jgi:hypothetical protein